jgi:hypothetical protein
MCGPAPAGDSSTRQGSGARAQLCRQIELESKQECTHQPPLLISHLVNRIRMTLPQPSCPLTARMCSCRAIGAMPELIFRVIVSLRIGRGWGFVPLQPRGIWSAPHENISRCNERLRAACDHVYRPGASPQGGGRAKGNVPAAHEGRCREGYAPQGWRKKGRSC